MNDLLLKKTVKEVSDFINKFDKNIKLISKKMILLLFKN